MQLSDYANIAAWLAPYIAFCAGLICPALFVAWLVSRLAAKRLVRLNFQGKPVPVIGGIAALLAAGAWLVYLYNSVWASSVFNHKDQLIAVTIALYGFGALGLLDDLFGDRSTGGFRGHFTAFLRERKITTGVVKAVGGGLVSLVCAYYLAEWMLPESPFYPNHPAHDGALAFALSCPLYAALIALSANTLNLLDLRPGRADFAATVSSFCVLLPAAVITLGYIDMLAAALLGFCLVLYLFDRAGKIMLGDCGSNAIGAALAACWICVSNRWEIAIGVALLSAFQVWCEKHSLSRFIESKPLLRALDRKIGVR